MSCSFRMWASRRRISSSSVAACSVSPHTSHSTTRIWLLLAQGSIEVVGGADQRQMGERLREVPELLAGGADLLGVEAEVVGVGEHLLERQPGLVHPARAG